MIGGTATDETGRGDFSRRANGLRHVVGSFRSRFAFGHVERAGSTGSEVDAV